MLNLMEHIHIVAGVMPADIGAAASTGDAVNLKNYAGCLVVFLKAAGTSAENPTLTLLQAQDAAATGEKALNITEYYKASATSLAAGGQFTKTSMTEGNVITADGALEEIYVVDIPASWLDRDNSFDWISANVSDPGTVDTYGCVVYILYGPRFAQEANISPIA